MTTSQIISMALAYRKGTRDLQGESGTVERDGPHMGVGRTRGPQRLRKTGRLSSTLILTEEIRTIYRQVEVLPNVTH
jgi:hypothetical protein